MATKRENEIRTASLQQPSRRELNDLVLEYLSHSPYTRTARAFVRDSAEHHVDPDGDETMGSSSERADDLPAGLQEVLVLGERRKEVRTHILTGSIDDAIALLNKHFPSVLSETMEDDSRLSTRFEYIPSVSTDPTHLALNLRIQGFIEATRTVPLYYYPPGSETPLPHPPLPAVASSGEDTDMTKSATNDEATNALLHRAQNLYSSANSLPLPHDRAQYLYELGKVGSLLAYPHPERSPNAIYMAQDRRDALANQIDSAILYRLRRPTVSRIELYARVTTTIWSVLHELDVAIPPRSTWPKSVSLPLPWSGLSSNTNNETTSKKGVVEQERAEILPRFDLRLWLNSSEAS